MVLMFGSDTMNVPELGTTADDWSVYMFDDFFDWWIMPPCVMGLWFCGLPVSELTRMMPLPADKLSLKLTVFVFSKKSFSKRCTSYGTREALVSFVRVFRRSDTGAMSFEASRNVPSRR